MTAGRLYLTGAGALVVLGAAGAMTLDPAASRAVSLSLALALAVQGPLGWWLIRSIGTPRFLGVWVAGILTRFGLLGVVALGVLPALGWPVAPGAIALTVLLLAFLGLEIAVLLAQQSKAEAQ